MTINASTLRRLAKKAIDTVSDLTTAITYVQVTPGGYDPATDTTADLLTEYQNVPAVLMGLRDNEIDWFPADQVIQRAVIAAEDLPGVTPTSNDYVLIGGVRWEITRVRYVTGDPIYILFLREP